MDYIKGRCMREKCKYFHPPAHLQAKIKAAQHQANQAAVAAQAAAAAATVMVSGARAPRTFPEARAPGAAPSARARARAPRRREWGRLALPLLRCLRPVVVPPPRPFRFRFVPFLPPSLRSTISKSLRRAQGSQGWVRGPLPKPSAPLGARTRAGPGWKDQGGGLEPGREENRAEDAPGPGATAPIFLLPTSCYLLQRPCCKLPLSLKENLCRT